MQLASTVALKMLKYSTVVLSCRTLVFPDQISYLLQQISQFVLIKYAYPLAL